MWPRRRHRSIPFAQPLTSRPRRKLFGNNWSRSARFLRRRNGCFRLALHFRYERKFTVPASGQSDAASFQPAHLSNPSRYGTSREDSNSPSQPTLHRWKNGLRTHTLRRCICTVFSSPTVDNSCSPHFRMVVLGLKAQPGTVIHSGRRRTGGCGRTPLFIASTCEFLSIFARKPKTLARPARRNKLLTRSSV